MKKSHQRPKPGVVSNGRVCEEGEDGVGQRSRTNQRVSGSTLKTERKSHLHQRSQKESRVSRRRGLMNWVVFYYGRTETNVARNWTEKGWKGKHIHPPSWLSRGYGGKGLGLTWERIWQRGWTSTILSTMRITTLREKASSNIWHKHVKTWI